eukprot:GFYU01005672.1.p1 GENE.GFYU01005672.1~~GFYU01005672.1.p1  ORF type:complete len:170 (-),score=18.72 GFYU01005672.1:101-586(-)
MVVKSFFIGAVALLLINACSAADLQRSMFSRGEQLERLSDKSDQLNESAGEFHSLTHQLLFKRYTEGKVACCLYEKNGQTKASCKTMAKCFNEKKGKLVVPDTWTPEHSIPEILSEHKAESKYTCVDSKVPELPGGKGDCRRYGAGFAKWGSCCTPAGALF